jgi:hypothetical protein
LAPSLAITTDTKYVASFSNFVPNQAWIRSGQSMDWYTRGDIGQSWSGALHVLNGYDTYFWTNVTSDVAVPLTECTVEAVYARDNPGSGGGTGTDTDPATLASTGFDAAPLVGFALLASIAGMVLLRRRTV